MAAAVQAIYERGVFRPLQPVGLAEGQQIVPSVEALQRVPEDVAAQLAGRFAVFDGLSDDDIAEVEKLALGERQGGDVPQE